MFIIGLNYSTDGETFICNCKKNYDSLLEILIREYGKSEYTEFSALQSQIMNNTDTLNLLQTRKYFVNNTPLNCVGY
jgi:hypothetical protein